MGLSHTYFISPSFLPCTRITSIFDARCSYITVPLLRPVYSIYRGLIPPVFSAVGGRGRLLKLVCLRIINYRPCCDVHVYNVESGDRAGQKNPSIKVKVTRVTVTELRRMTARLRCVRHIHIRREIYSLQHPITSARRCAEFRSMFIRYAPSRRAPALDCDSVSNR